MHALHSKKLYKNIKLWLILSGIILCVFSILLFVNASFADPNTNQDSDFNVTEEVSNDSNDSYLTFTSSKICYWSLELRNVGNPDSVNLEWTNDSGRIVWQPWNSVIHPVTTGDFISIRGTGNNTFAKSQDDYWYISFWFDDDITFDVSGNIMSLLDYQSPPTAISSDYCFCKFFNNVDCLQSCENLSLPNNVRPHCYESMFEGCTDLTKAPNLPAEDLTYMDGGVEKDATACYKNMFKGCSSLSTASDLPATKLADSCYQGMFSRTWIGTPPSLPATELKPHCYDSMFEVCEYLEIGEEEAELLLPADSLEYMDVLTEKEAVGCYKSMFSGCLSLIRMPTLKATELVESCYQEMFKDCRSLTLNKLEFSNIVSLGDYCCYEMFCNCSAIELVDGFTSASADAKPYCYASMFNYCYNIKTNFKESKTQIYLNETKLAEGCYSGMFAYCNSLVCFPKLPSVKLCDKCYQAMFKQCYVLLSEPPGNNSFELKFLNTAPFCCEQMFYMCLKFNYYSLNFEEDDTSEACCSQMFYNCSSITKTAFSGSANLSKKCYYGMYEGCSELIDGGKLNGFLLSENCYENMFLFCYKLSIISFPTKPISPSAYCCSNMFSNCKNLKYVENMILSGKEGGNLPYMSYSEMFYNCTSINYIKISFTSWENDSTKDWLTGASLKGYFECPEELDTSARDTSHVPEGWIVANKELLHFDYALADDNYASIKYNFETKTGGKTLNLKYSKDLVNWEDLNVSQTTAEPVEIEKVSKSNSLWIYGTDEASFVNQNCSFSFVTDEPIKVGGDVMSLMTVGKTTIPNSYCFNGLFKGCTGLTNTLKLPDVPLTEGCYQSMYEGCENLELPCDLTATELQKNCYAYMFKGCTSLIKAPELVATELKDGCYMGMFDGCKALTRLKVGFSSWFDGGGTEYTWDHIPTYNWLANTTDMFFNPEKVFYCPPDLDGSKIDDSHVAETWTVYKDSKINAVVYGYNEEYDGQAHTITVSVTSPSDADIKYKGPDDDDFKEANPGFTDAGTYTVEVKISKANYVTLQTSADVVIQKSTSGTMSLGSFEKFYSGAEPDYTATFNGLDITPVKGVDYVTYREPGEDVLENDGAYTVHAVWINNNSNFDVAEATGSLTIKKASAKLVADKNSMAEGEGMPTLTAHLEGARFGVDDLASDDYSVEPVNNGDGTYTLNPNLTEKGQRFLKNFNVEMVPSVLKVYSTGGGGGGGGTEVVTETVTVTEQLPGTTQEIVKTEKGDDKVSYMGQNNSSEDNDGSPLSPIAIASLIANALLLAGLVFMALKFRKAL